MINPDAQHPTLRDTMLQAALTGALSNPSVVGTTTDRRATKAAKLAIEAVDELIRLENLNDETGID